MTAQPSLFDQQTDRLEAAFNAFRAGDPAAPVPSVARAEHSRENAIRAVGGRAGEEWIEDAVDALDAYGLASFPDAFLIEDVREWAAEYRPKLSAAPDGRAWGAVVRVAKSRGMIAQVGYRAARSSRMGPKALWRYVPAEYRE